MIFFFGIEQRWLFDARLGGKVNVGTTYLLT